MIGPEDLGCPRLLRWIADLGVAQDLRCALEGDAGVEARKEGFEEADSGLGAGEIEGVEDVREKGFGDRQGSAEREGLMIVDFRLSIVNTRY
jgi:hypothetical protein